MDPGIIMALGSALASGIGGLTGGGAKRSSTYSKAQRGTIDDIIGAIKGMRGGAEDITQQPGYQTGMDWLMSLYNDPEFFRNFEAPLQRQFQEQIVPELATRYGAMGSGGSTGSTGYRNQLAREGSILGEKLGTLRGQMQQGAIPQLLGYAQQPFSNLQSMQGQVLGAPIYNQYQPPSPGLFGSMAGPLAAGAVSYWGGRGGMNPNSQGGLSAGQHPSTTPIGGGFGTAMDAFYRSGLGTGY